MLLSLLPVPLACACPVPLAYCAPSDMTIAPSTWDCRLQIVDCIADCRYALARFLPVCLLADLPLPSTAFSVRLCVCLSV